jgi:hypothetical protein
MGGCIGISPSYGTLRVSTASLAAREVFCIQASKPLAEWRFGFKLQLILIN